MRALTTVLCVMGVLLVVVPAAADDGSYTIRRRPFSLTEEYEIREHGTRTGTIRRRPFSLTPEYEVRDQYGRTQGVYRQKPFSLYGDEWEFRPR